MTWIRASNSKSPPSKKSACDLFFDFGGRLGVYQGCHEGSPIGEDEIGGNRSDVFEEAFSGALGLAGLDPQAFETVADGVHGEGQQVHGGEQHGEVLLAVAEIMFEMIAVVFEDVEALVLDFPSRPGAGGDLGDVLARDLERGDEGAVIGRFPLGVADGDADPIDAEGVLAVAQRRS